MTAQILDQFVAALVAISRTLRPSSAGCATVPDRLPIERIRSGFPLHHFEHQAERRFLGERHASGQAFEQYDAERENVRALIDRLAEATSGDR